jgi:hypothetical protein
VLAAPPAQVVVLAHAIAGVSLGSKRAALTARLGKGVVVKSGKGSFGHFAIVRYAKPAVSVTFVQGFATDVATTSRAYPTRQGIAVGSSKARVRATYGSRLRCGNFQICTLGDALPGHAVTTFDLQGGRVARIDVSSVLD